MSPSPTSAVLWVAGFQMGLYALMWLLSLVLLHESRAAVAHWMGFMALLGVGFVLAALRDDPREWLTYNGANVATVLAFGLMRRGGERFMGVPPHDREQLATLLPAVALFAWLGPGRDEAPLRTAATYGLQALILARTLWTIRPALASEFGRRTMLGVVVPGTVLVAVLALLLLRQFVAWPEVRELQARQRVNVGLITDVPRWHGGVQLRLPDDGDAAPRRAAARSVDARRAHQPAQRAMNETLAWAWLRHRRTRSPLAAFVIDLDHFKRINDSGGHAAGDAVLVRMAARWRFRSSCAASCDKVRLAARSSGSCCRTRRAGMRWRWPSGCARWKPPGSA
ncbi:MAG: diguanylate cyclase [Rubrivivax sp.]